MQILNIHCTPEYLLIQDHYYKNLGFRHGKALFNIPEYKLRDVMAEASWDKQQEVWNKLVKSCQN